MQTAALSHTWRPLNSCRCSLGLKQLPRLSGCCSSDHLCRSHCSSDVCLLSNSAGHCDRLHTYSRTRHGLQSGRYLSTLASVWPCNPAAVALVSVLGSSVTQMDTIAALYFAHSIVLPWTWRHNEALIQTGLGDWQPWCQLLFFPACELLTPGEFV